MGIGDWGLGINADSEYRYSDIDIILTMLFYPIFSHKNISFRIYFFVYYTMYVLHI